MGKTLTFMLGFLRWFLMDAKNKGQKELVLAIVEGVLYHAWEDEEVDKAAQEWTAEILFELEMESDVQELIDEAGEDMRYFLARLMELQNAVERTCECGEELDDDGLCHRCIKAAEATTQTEEPAPEAAPEEEDGEELHGEDCRCATCAPVTGEEAPPAEEEKPATVEAATTEGATGGTDALAQAATDGGTTPVPTEEPAGDGRGTGVVEEKDVVSAPATEASETAPANVPAAGGDTPSGLGGLIGTPEDGDGVARTETVPAEPAAPAVEGASAPEATPEEVPAA